MSRWLHDFRFPNESDEYRDARDKLLRAERELLAEVERVAEMRRALPPGGEVPEDYVFEEGPADLRDNQSVREVRLSELFDDGKDTLILINTMFAPGAERPCPMCNALADGYNANAPHVSDRVNFALVTRAPLQKLRDWAARRGWRDIRLLSSYNSSFNRDYRAETADDEQWPSITVFRREADGTIRHFYSVEGQTLETPEGQDGRMLDPYWPLWNLLDLTPEGRGSDWYPKYAYD